MSQQFAKLQADCLTLDCAVARKSYSFDAMPDSQESSTTATTPPKPATKSDSVREGAWRKLPSNFVHDQKDLWLFPVRVAQGHYWLPTALFTGATAALIATDPQTMPYFRQTDFFQDSDHALGSKVSGGGDRRGSCDVLRGELDSQGLVRTGYQFACRGSRG